jgi:hypothetical protein
MEGLAGAGMETGVAVPDNGMAQQATQMKMRLIIA